MAQKTDLNVAPYYDDFDKDDNFKKVLFRPGFAVQARELTQLQSTLQDQIEQHSNHIFKEGAMVIPGQLSLNLRFYTLKLATTFASETINPSQYDMFQVFLYFCYDSCNCYWSNNWCESKSYRICSGNNY